MSDMSVAFDQLVETLEEEGKSTRAYKSCAAIALAHAKKNSAFAAPFLLLALGAQKFVDSYEGEPISSPEVDAEFEAFSTNVSALKAAFSGDSADDRLGALNRVAMNLA